MFYTDLNVEISFLNVVYKYRYKAYYACEQAASKCKFCLWNLISCVDFCMKHAAKLGKWNWLSDLWI
jgi:hypothetical protein